MKDLSRGSSTFLNAPPEWSERIASSARRFRGSMADRIRDYASQKKGRRSIKLYVREDYTEPFSMERLSREQRERLVKAFKYFDKDGTGTIDAKELIQVLRVMGHSPTTNETEELLQELDTDGNGELSLEEFGAAWWRREQSKLEDDFEEQLKLAFNVFDVNGDGQISADELRGILTTMGEVMTNEEVDALLAECDVDGSGVIDMQEFKNMPCWIPPTAAGRRDRVAVEDSIDEESSADAPRAADAQVAAPTPAPARLPPLLPQATRLDTLYCSRFFLTLMPPLLDCSYIALHCPRRP